MTAVTAARSFASPRRLYLTSHFHQTSFSYLNEMRREMLLPMDSRLPSVCAADGRLNIDFHRLLIKASLAVVVVVVGPPAPAPSCPHSPLCCTHARRARFLSSSVLSFGIVRGQSKHALLSAMLLLSTRPEGSTSVLIEL